MSVFTDLATLRNHLQAFDFDAIEINFEPVVLFGTDTTQLPHNGLADDSVTVYTQQANTPTGPIETTLNGETWINSGYDALLPATVVVAADEYPLKRYIEGLDYAVNEEKAQIKRLAGGSIPDGGTVFVWLLPLSEATVDVDYEIDLDQGTLARLPGGNLPDPARVYVSYATTRARASEGLLNQAIADAEGKILARLKPEYDETSGDYGLALGTTELALAYVCDDLAAGVLSRNGDSSSDNRARRFMELALRYEDRALHNLTPFIRLPLPTASRRQQNVPSASW
ncbi:hypothetical protein KQI52_05440 [bacterium]|nr:hypothetical protein [bacterium]